MAHHAPSSTDQPCELGHEPDRFSVRFVVGVGVGLAVIIAVAMGLMVVMFNYWASLAPAPTERPASLQQAYSAPVEPALEPDKRKNLAELRAAEQQQLQSYAWVDEKDGIARIPIDRAIEILVKDGLPEVEQELSDDTQ